MRLSSRLDYTNGCKAGSTYMQGRCGLYVRLFLLCEEAAKVSPKGFYISCKRIVSKEIANSHDAMRLVLQESDPSNDECVFPCTLNSLFGRLQTQLIALGFKDRGFFWMGFQRSMM